MHSPRASGQWDSTPFCGETAGQRASEKKADVKRIRGTSEGLSEIGYQRLDADVAVRILAVSLDGEMLRTAPDTPNGVARFLIPGQPDLGVSAATIYAWPLLQAADVPGSHEEGMRGTEVPAIRLVLKRRADEQAVWGPQQRL